MELSAQMRKPTGLSGQRVLVVDDDVELCQLISQYLGREGLAVEVVHTGQKGVERALSAFGPNLVCLC
jgi:DNA-binding response OmpR family regulator